MQVRLILLLVALFSANIATTAQSAIPSSTSVDSYESRIVKLAGGATGLDYTALRIAYSRTKGASPYGADHDIRGQMNAAVIEKRCDQAIKIADSILLTIYLSPDTHAAMSTCYRASGDNPKADLHKAIYLGLINSILAKGDGDSPETAYVVITIEEEYAVMRSLGFTVWNYEFIHKGEHTYNLLSGTDDRNNRTIKIYFNVDIPLSIEKQRNVSRQ